MCAASLSPLLPERCLPVSAQAATGRGGPTQELNNNFQQSSQEAGSPDCGCSLQCSALPPLGRLLPPPAGLCLLHRTDAFCRQASALKGTHATFLSFESLQ
uniref:Uncharacterized protein n=1 Tax=Knipowitschia caucasica TaxID=637954 RepID=A0AAV2M884_KNICA